MDRNLSSGVPSEIDDSRSDRGLLRKWLTGGHDFKFPFSESRMRMAIEGARRKSQRTGAAPIDAAPVTSNRHE